MLRAPCAVGVSDGVWEVFHAPHMARMSNPVGVNFKPVRYGGVSQVVYSTPVCSFDRFARLVIGRERCSDTIDQKKRTQGGLT